MHTLTSIVRVDAHDDLYEVVVDLDGQRRAMVCRVLEHTGIRVVQPTPDLLSTLPFSPRPLVAAVLAFHDARREAESSSI